MANTTENQWIFTDDKIKNSPSFRDGMDWDTELTYRQYTATFISDLGNKIKVGQICINTAIIYMHRFYMIHSFKKFHHNIVAVSCLFFACKVEEHPTPLKKFIDAVQQLLHKDAELLNPNSEEYKLRWDEIIAHESCLIQTLGFNVLINHAHTHIIKTCQMIRAPRDLAQTAYFMASNSLILTNFCVKYTCDKVACFCIHLACKWTGLKIPTSNEGRHWYQYVNSEITAELLEDISNEYIEIYTYKCPNKIKIKLAQQSKTAQDEEDKKNERPTTSQEKSQSDNSTTPRSTSSTNKPLNTSVETKSYKEHVEIKKESNQENTTTTTTTTSTKIVNKVSTTVTVNPQNTSQSQQHPHQQHRQHPYPHPHPQHHQQQLQQRSSIPPQHQQQSQNIPTQNQIKQPHPSQMSINRNQNIKPNVPYIHTQHLQQQQQQQQQAPHHPNHHQYPQQHNHHHQQQPHNYHHHHQQQQQQQHHHSQTHSHPQHHPHSNHNKSSPLVKSNQQNENQHNNSNGTNLKNIDDNLKQRLNPTSPSVPPSTNTTTTTTTSSTTTPLTQSTVTTNTSNTLKRSNDEHLNSVPNKIAKYISEKSVS